MTTDMLRDDITGTLRGHRTTNDVTSDIILELTELAFHPLPSPHLLTPPSTRTSAKFSIMKKNSVNTRIISGAINSCVLLLSSARTHTLHNSILLPVIM